MQDHERHAPVKIRFGSKQQCYAKGGLTGAAENVKDAGRYGDDMVVHINRNEFEELRGKWGEPTINPDTGMPEFFLSGLRDWLGEN